MAGVLRDGADSPGQRDLPAGGQARQLPRWQGASDDNKDFTVEHAPCMRWTPMNGPEKFRTPDMMGGDLLISCEMITRGCAATT